MSEPEDIVFRYAPAFAVVCTNSMLTHKAAIDTNKRLPESASQ